MSVAHAFIAVLALAACSLDSSGLVSDAGGTGDIDSSGPADFDGGEAADAESGSGDANIDDGATPDVGGRSECTGLVNGAFCAGGICVDESCMPAEPTELGAGSLSVYETDSTTDSADDSVDDERNSRWTSFDDDLPRYIVYRLDRSYYVAGVRVDSGDWSHCGQSDVFLSPDGVTWGSPIASYTASDPLPNDSAALFGSSAAAEFIKIEVNARTDGGSYCYIAELRALVFDI